ncbi:MAG: DNA repair protein RadC [Candidatus Hydrogenedentes bacterium]|nr:DNA repair protein RadC [Candidatus Hydrogenedentota bacterium]
MKLESPYSSAVREMPAEDRPRERLAKLGAEALRDAELLALLFRSGTRKRGAVALADEVLKEFGNLRGLARASLEELRQVKGLGKVKAIEIKAALELGKRLADHRESGRTRIGCAEDVAALLMIHFKDCETEEFKTLLLNAKNELIRTHGVSQGGLDSTMALPREVFRQAVRQGVTKVIVCHNHPSGDPEPSRDDILLTKRLNESATILGLELVDHIVFGDGRYVSLKERNLM